MSINDLKPSITPYLAGELIRFAREGAALSKLAGKVSLLTDDVLEPVERMRESITGEDRLSDLASEFVFASLAGVYTILRCEGQDLAASYRDETCNPVFLVELSYPYMDVGEDCDEVRHVYLIPKEDKEQFVGYMAAQYLRRGNDVYSIEPYSIALSDMTRHGPDPAKQVELIVFAPGGMKQQLLPISDGPKIKLIRVEQKRDRVEALKLIRSRGIDKAI